MRCPGQDTQFWNENSIFEANCPKCGAVVEFFKDDTARKCGSCEHRFANPKMDFGCASYCQYAEQCLGSLPPELLAQRGDLLKDRVAIEMKRYFKSDFKRIGHATRVARYAERIGKEENGNLSVILCAAYLHDIGIHEAEKIYNSTDARYLAELGPGVAKGILEKLSATAELSEEVLALVGHSEPSEDAVLNFRILSDAVLIAGLEDKKEEEQLEADDIKQTIAEKILTDSGKELARQVLLS